MTAVSKMDEGASAPFSTLIPALNVGGCGELSDRLDNIRANCARTTRRQNYLEEKKVPLIVAGYGPSLTDGVPAIINDIQKGADLITVSGSHDFLISRGIIPDCHAEMDPRERKAEFVKAPHKDVHYLIASVCHPKVFDRLDGYKVNMWHLGEPGTVKEIARLDTVALIHPSAQAIGLNALVLGYTLGYREFILHGLDCCYLDGKAHPGWHNGNNHDDACMDIRCGDRIFSTRPEWIQYARNFIDDMIPKFTGLGCTFAIHGDGLLQHMVREGLKEAA